MKESSLDNLESLSYDKQGNLVASVSAAGRSIRNMLINGVVSVDDQRAILISSQITKKGDLCQIVKRPYLVSVKPSLREAIAQVRLARQEEQVDEELDATPLARLQELDEVRTIVPECRSVSISKTS